MAICLGRLGTISPESLNPLLSKFIKEICVSLAKVK